MERFSCFSSQNILLSVVGFSDVGFLERAPTQQQVCYNFVLVCCTFYFFVEIQNLIETCTFHKLYIDHRRAFLLVCLLLVDYIVYCIRRFVLLIVVLRGNIYISTNHRNTNRGMDRGIYGFGIHRGF